MVIALTRYIKNILIGFIIMQINIEGQVKGDLLIQEGIVFVGGEISGDIEASKVAVQEQSKFDGRLVADFLVSMGQVKGECHCKKIQLKENSETSAILISEDIRIEDGAKITGSIKNLPQKL